MTEPARIPTVELEPEQEIDLARYWQALAARWWLPFLGLAGGIVLGLALALGGSQVWKARAVVYLGQPLSPSGAQVQSLATNPSTVTEIIHSEAAVSRVAAATGLTRGKIRSGATSQPIKGNLAKLGQTPLVAISVKGDPPGKVARAANLLAQIVVAKVSDYPEAKIKTYEDQIAQDETEIANIDRRTTEIQDTLGSLSPSERVSALALLGFAEQRRGIVGQDLRETRQALALAKNVERSRVMQRAVARKTTARSKRNSVVVGGVLGVLLGTVAALLWEPLARRRAASSA